MPWWASSRAVSFSAARSRSAESELEMHRDSLREGAAVLVVDDLLATGSTAAAAGELVHRQGAYVHAYAFVIELISMGGRQRLLPTPTLSVVRYD